MNGILQDLHHALRQLQKSPGFLITAVLAVAFGIGATTAIFSLMQQVMLQSLAVTRPGELWRIGDAEICCYHDGYSQGDGDSAPQNDWNFFSWDAYKFFRANTSAFQDLAAFQIGGANAHLAIRRTGSTAPVETGNGEYVSGNFFESFGIAPWRGRFFADSDDRAGSPPVAVMSFHTWQGTYGSDLSVTGATYLINGHPFTVIGVAPPNFVGAKKSDSDMPDFWLPLATEPIIAGATSRLENPRLAWLDLIGRVRPGTNPKMLEAQLRVELHAWLASHAADMSSQEKAVLENQTLRLTPGGRGVSLMRKKYEDALWLLLLASLCVLLVSCANLANLLLARGLKQRHQIALRMALGASRARLVRKTLVESLTISLLGAAAGVAIAYLGAALILHLAFAQPDMWAPVSASPSVPALLFALGISVITGMAFGIAPALMTSHARPSEALRGATFAIAGNRHSFQKTLVIVQAAVSVVLVGAAAMLAQSLRNLQHQNFGFKSEARYLVSINPKLSNYKQERLATLFYEMEERLRSLPGVRNVGSVLEAPLNGWVWPHQVVIEGKPEPGPNDDIESGWTRITPGFFDVIGGRIMMGRNITDQDNASTQPTAVINESFAKKFFRSENPIGQHFGPTAPQNAGMYEIVGVASNMDFGHGPQPMYFLPEAQSTNLEDPESREREIGSHYLYNIVIWAPGHQADIEAKVRRALAEVDSDLVVNGVRPYSAVIHTDFAPENMIASLTWLFGAVGLALAAVGLYGVTAYGVAERTSELGIRLAMGADRRSVLLMVLGGAFKQVGTGLAVGIPAAIGAGSMISSHLFGVRPFDPLMLATATLALGLAALIAAVIPARRAANLDPMVALRYE